MSARDELERQRARLKAADAATARDLIRRYGTTWARIRARLNRLLDEIERAKAGGETINAGWLAAHGHLETVDRTANLEVRVFASHAERTIDKAVLQALAAGAHDADTLLRAAVAGWSPSAPIAETLAIARAARPGAPLGTLLESLGPQAAEAARTALIEGVVTGQGTREIARALRVSFGGNATRALRVARTEVIGVYRAATIARYRASGGAVRGWTWIASLDRRTCAACIAMHGTEHTLDETLDSHPACRCTMAPLTATFASLGAPGVPETGFATETGPAWFERQPVAVQREILGPGKLAAYKAGRLTLPDLVEPTISPVWGPGMRERALRHIAA